MSRTCTPPPGHGQTLSQVESEDWERVLCLSVELLEWLDREASRAWHSDRCVMFIPDTWLSLQETRPAWLLVTWPYLAAVCRRHLSPSLLASLSLSRVFSTSHRTVSCRPHWNKNISQNWQFFNLPCYMPRQKTWGHGSHLESRNQRVNFLELTLCIKLEYRVNSLDRTFICR